MAVELGHDPSSDLQRHGQIFHTQKQNLFDVFAVRACTARATILLLIQAAVHWANSKAQTQADASRAKVDFMCSIPTSISAERALSEPIVREVLSLARLLDLAGFLIRMLGSTVWLAALLVSAFCFKSRLRMAYLIVLALVQMLAVWSAAL